MEAPKISSNNCMPTMVCCNMAIRPKELLLSCARKKKVVIDFTIKNFVAYFFLLGPYSTLFVTMDRMVARAVIFCFTTPMKLFPNPCLLCNCFCHPTVPKDLPSNKIAEHTKKDHSILNFCIIIVNNFQNFLPNKSF